MVSSLNLKKATFDQDRAAGGAGRRKLKVKSGDVVTVSLVASGVSPYRVILRFKSGLTIQREVGRFPAASPEEAVRLGWQAIRGCQIVEREGWSWMEE